MPLSLTFTEPATVNTGQTFFESGAVYDSGHATWVVVGFRSPSASASAVQVSVDGGLTWALKTFPAVATWRAVTYAPTLGAAGRLVACGNGVSAWSDDGGQTWSAATSLPEANTWTDVQWWPAKSIFVMGAQQGGFPDLHRVATSTDGKSWTMRTDAFVNKGCHGVAVSATTAVIVAFTGASTDNIQTSTDGINWTLQTHTSFNTFRMTGGAGRLGIGYSPDLDMFLITGTDAGGFTYAYRSTDSGVTWTASQAIPTIGDSTNRSYIWLATPQTWFMSCANFNYGESTDGDTWTVTPMSTVSHGSYLHPYWDDTSATLISGSTLGFDVVLRGVVPPVVITITPTTVPTAYGAVAYSAQLTGVGGTAPYLFTQTAGALPTGISLSILGLVSGTTPTTATLSPTTLPTGVVDVSYTQTLSVAAISTPYSFTARATDANAAFGDQAYTLTVSDWAGPATYAVVVGTLPKCFSLNSLTGVLSGTPMLVASTTFTIRATDAVGATVDRSYTLTATS